MFHIIAFTCEHQQAHLFRCHAGNEQAVESQPLGCQIFWGLSCPWQPYARQVSGNLEKSEWVHFVKFNIQMIALTPCLCKSVEQVWSLLVNTDGQQLCSSWMWFILCIVNHLQDSHFMFVCKSLSGSRWSCISRKMWNAQSHHNNVLLRNATYAFHYMIYLNAYGAKY